VHRIALKKSGLQPNEVMMVGNRISKDVLGGNKLGMKTVLIKWNNRYSEKITNKLEKPDFTIRTLKEIIPIIRKIETEARA